jgi:hypothetical protein
MLSKKIHIARSIVIASLAVFLSGPAFAAAATPAAPTNNQVVVPVRRAPAPTGATTTTTASTGATQSYAARENQAKGLETFRGGDGGVYIGSGVLVVVLLVVLILVLI